MKTQKDSTDLEWIDIDSIDDLDDYDTDINVDTNEDNDIDADDITLADENDDEIDEDTEIIKPIEKKKKKKKKSWIKRILFIVLGTILTFVIVLAATLMIMRATGKKGLYNRASSSGPNFIRDEDSNGENNGELDIDIDNMDNISNVENPSQGSSTNNDSSNNNTGNNGTTDTPSNIIIATDKDAEYDVIYKGTKYVYNDDIITLLILGIDNYQAVSPAKDGISGGQSDSIFLVVMNPDTKKIDIIAIPRDTISKIWIYDKNGDFVQTGNAQICLQHGYGDGMKLSNERALKAISYLMYDLPIHSVTSINMGAVGMLNDAIGGVTLESLDTFNYSGFSFTKGKTVTLKGHMTFSYINYRDCSRHNTASERLARQKQYISIFIKQALNAVKKDLDIVTDVYNIISDYVVTDLKLDEMVYLASESVSYNFGEFISLQGTLDTSMRYERYYLDEEKLQELIIEKFYNKVK